MGDPNVKTTRKTLKALVKFAKALDEISDGDGLGRPALSLSLRLSGDWDVDTDGELSIGGDVAATGTAAGLAQATATVRGAHRRLVESEKVGGLTLELSAVWGGK